MRQLFFLAGVVASFFANGQDVNPVKWTATFQRINDTVGEVRFLAGIDHPWHIYSQSGGTGVGRPTTIHFEKNPLFALKGGVVETGKLDSTVIKGVNVKYFKVYAQFVQKVDIKKRAKTTILCSISFMACTNYQCLPPQEQQFRVRLE